MVIDFSVHPKIPATLSPLFSEVSRDIRREFCETIDKVSKGNLENLDWHFCGPASRNIFDSPLFTYCCGLAFLQELVKQQIPVAEIRTDSPALGRIVARWLSQEGIKAHVRVKPAAANRIKCFLGRALSSGWLSC